MAKSLSELLIATRELRAGSVITESEISALKRRWSPMGRLAATAYEESIEFMEGGPYHIGAEQTEKGKQYWRALMLKSNGTIRNTVFTRGMSVKDQLTAQQIHRFELVDWEFISSNNGMRAWPYPVYRALDVAGNSFDYYAGHWMLPEIL